MRVLLTNDDGVMAPGLAVLGRALQAAGHRLVVAAPDRERSGSGTSLGTIEPDALVKTRPVTIPRLHPDLALAVDAPPALAVHAAAAGALGPVPDAIVVGVNPGFNTGVGVLHSSTVGAAVSAVALGLPAVAVSCRADDPSAFGPAATVGVAAVEAVVEQDQPICLNVNVGARIPTPDRVALVPLAGSGLWHLDLVPEPGGLRLRPGWRTAAAADTDAGVVLAGGIAVSALTGCLATAGDLPAGAAVRRLTGLLPPTP